MHNKIIFLKDTKVDGWILNGLKYKNYEVIYCGIENLKPVISFNRIHRIILLHSKLLLSAINALKITRDRDVIICFLDVHAFYVFIIMKLLKKRRILISLNIMINDYSDYLSQIKKLFFKIMLRNENVFPTVSSQFLVSKYKQIFSLPQKKFFLLNDCYRDLEKCESNYKKGNGTVFCGGTNGRDWNLILNLAKILPDIQFIIVGPKRDIFNNEIPTNIKYYYNIPFNNFQKLISDCSVVALPLNTDAPAGIIVLFTAGLMSKVVVATENDTMKEYITSGENGFLVKMGDINAFASKVATCLSDTELQIKLGENLHKKVKEKGSPEQYVKRINDILQEILE